MQSTKVVDVECVPIPGFSPRVVLKFVLNVLLCSQHYTADEERIQPPTPSKERKGDLFSRSRIPVHTSVRRILSVSEDSRYTASVQD